jgi:hypothetical protein
MKTIPRLIAALVIASTSPSSLIAQQGDTESPDAFVASLGAVHAADSCLALIERTATELVKRQPSIDFGSDADGGMCMRCVRWAGVMNLQRALPNLERVIAQERAGGDDDPLAQTAYVLRQDAFLSRVRLLLTSGKREELFGELLHLFDRSAPMYEHTEHERALGTYGLVALKTHDDFYPLLVREMRKRFLPPPTLPAPDYEAFLRYESFLRFTDLIGFDTPAKREALLTLFDGSDATGIELGLVILDESPETVSALLDHVRSEPEERKPALVHGLRAIREGYRARIEKETILLRGMTTEESDTKRLEGHIARSRSLVAAISAAIGE